MSSPAQWFRERYRIIWWTLFAFFALPAIDIVWDYYHQQLGENPLQTLLSTTGRWSLIFLLITLTITPLRQILCNLCLYLHGQYGKRLEDWNWIIRMRRMLGLYCFFYATLHTLIYVLFDLALNWSWAISDIKEKPYIVLGVIAFIMLIPLAITSHTKLFLLMGLRRWKRLHRSIYLIVIIVILHFWWQSKVGVYDYLPYTAITIYLLGFRLLNWLGILRRNPQDDGMETKMRD